MPLIAGTILPGGAVIDVMVGVSAARQRLLLANALPVPYPVAVRVLIDTGSSHSGFAGRVFEELRVAPVGKMPLLTPSTVQESPHECDVFDVSHSLVANGAAHPFGTSRVILADCWMEDEGMEGLIGRDILDRCNFLYFGRERSFTLGFA
jgi:hypothetical protein